MLYLFPLLGFGLLVFGVRAWRYSHRAFQTA
jgi:hypothetical protein